MQTERKQEKKVTGVKGEEVDALKKLNLTAKSPKQKRGKSSAKKPSSTAGNPSESELLLETLMREDELMKDDRVAKIFSKSCFLFLFHFKVIGIFYMLRKYSVK